MANGKVTTNGKGINGIPDGFKTTEDGKPEIHFGHPASVIAEREKMQEELEERVIQPIGLLAGILVSVQEEEGKDNDGSMHEMMRSVGFLLGLVVDGSRKEIDKIVYGLDKDKLNSVMMEMALEKGFFDTKE